MVRYKKPWKLYSKPMLLSISHSLPARRYKLDTDMFYNCFHSLCCRMTVIKTFVSKHRGKINVSRMNKWIYGE